MKACIKYGWIDPKQDNAQYNRIKEIYGKDEQDISNIVVYMATKWGFNYISVITEEEYNESLSQIQKQQTSRSEEASSTELRL